MTIDDNARQGQAEQELTDLQERFVLALLQCPTIKAAAARVEITERTAHRYLAMSHIKAAYDRAKADLIQSTREYIQLQAAQSVQTIVELRDDTEVAPVTRLKAAHILAGRLVDGKTTEGETPAPSPEDAALFSFLTSIEIEAYEFHQGAMHRLLEIARKRQAEQTPPAKN